MNALGINTAATYTAFSKLNVNQNIISKENNIRNDIEERVTKKSDRKISQLIDEVNSENKGITSLKIRPQFIPGTPISSTADSDKVFLDKHTSATHNIHENTKIISITNELKLVEHNQINDQFAAKGFFITLSKKHPQTDTNNYTISQSEKLLRKYKNDDSTRVGSLINIRV